MCGMKDESLSGYYTSTGVDKPFKRLKIPTNGSKDSCTIANTPSIQQKFTLRLVPKWCFNRTITILLVAPYGRPLYKNGLQSQKQTNVKFSSLFRIIK